MDESRELYKNNVDFLDKITSSLENSKSDLFKLIEHGDNFIQRIESFNDIHNIVQKFDRLRDDLSQIDEIKMEVPLWGHILILTIIASNKR